MSYYIDWHIYHGPDPLDERNINADCAIIRRGPSPYGEADYPTIEDARAAVAAEWPEHREVTEADGHDWPDRYAIEGRPDDGEPVEVYKPGKYPRATADTSVGWYIEAIADAVTADTTDDEIEALVDRWRAEYEEDDIGYVRHLIDWDAIRDYAIEHRDALRAEDDAD